MKYIKYIFTIALLNPVIGFSSESTLACANSFLKKIDRPDEDITFPPLVVAEQAVMKNNATNKTEEQLALDPIPEQSVSDHAHDLIGNNMPVAVQDVNNFIEKLPVDKQRKLLKDLSKFSKDKDVSTEDMLAFSKSNQVRRILSAEEAKELESLFTPVVSRPPPIKQISISIGESYMDFVRAEGYMDFVRAYNAGKFAESNRYIDIDVGTPDKIWYEPEFIYAQVVEIVPDGIIVNAVNGAGAGNQVRLSFDDMFNKNGDFVVSVSSEAMKDIRHGKKKVESFNVPKSNESTQFKAQEYEGIFIDGMDETNEFIEWVRRFRADPSINPNTTHVEDLGDMVEGRLDVIKRGIIEENQNLDSSIREKMLSEKLLLFEGMAREARKRVKDEQVTLRWWESWNARIADLTDQSEAYITTNVLDRNMGTILSVEEFLENTMEINRSIGSAYPSHRMSFYTTNKLGIIAINRTDAEDIAPISLNTNTVNMDGVEMSPIENKDHDIIHFTNRSWREEKYSRKRFHQEFEDIVEDFPPDQRKMAETARFILVHELSLLHTYPRSVSSLLTDEHPDIFPRFFKEDDLQYLLPRSVDRTSKEEVTNYLSRTGELFDSIVNKIEKRVEVRP